MGNNILALLNERAGANQAPASSGSRVKELLERRANGETYNPTFDNSASSETENPLVSKYKEIAEANFASTKKTETQPARTKYLPALVGNEPEEKATAEVKSVIDSTMQSMSPAGLARRNQQKAEAEEQAKRDAAKSVIDASLGAMTPSGMNVVRRAQEQKAAGDTKLEKTKAELEHAKEMYKTYSTLHGSGQTTAQEKQTALEQMRRFESEISRLDSVIKNWGKEAGPTAAGAAAIEKHQAEIKETQQTKALYEAAYNKASEAKQRMDDFVRGKLAAGETLTAEEEAERRKIDRQYESALDNYENYAGGYVVRRARESLVDSAEGIVNELGYMGNVLNAVTLAEGGDVRAVQKAMGISNPRVDETVENYTRNVNPLVSWGDVYSELTQTLYPSPTKTQKVAGDVAAGVAGMVPAMVAQVAAPGSGIYVTMLSAAGNATKEAMEAGADDMKALAYGMAVGSTEALIEKAFNGVAGVFGKGAADDVIEEYVKSHLRNETAQQAVIKLTGALGEGFEEFATEFANRLTNEIIIDTDDRSYLETLGDAGYSFLMGMAVSGIIQTASSLGGESNPKALAQKAVENVKQQMQQAREPSKADMLRLPTVEDIRNGRTFEPTETTTVAPLPSVEDVRKQSWEETETNDSTALVVKIQQAIPQINSIAPVAEVKGNEIPQGAKVTDRLMSFISSIGNKVTRRGFGEVLFTKSKIKSSMLGHGFGETKVETFAAVPAVIQNGVQIDYQTKWKGKPYDTYVFAAPVEYRGKTIYLGAVVQKDSVSNRYYLHEVVDETGNVIYKNTEAPASASDGTSALAGDLDTVANDGASDDIIAQSGAEYNSGNEKTATANGALPFKTGASLEEGEPGGYVPSEGSVLPEMTDVKENARHAATGPSIDEPVERSKSDEQKTNLEGMKRGVDELMNSWVEYATRKDPVSLSAEEREAIAASKIMTDYKESGDSLGEAGRKAWSFIKRKMIDSGEAVQRVAKATGDRYLYPYYNMARASSNAAVSMIVDAQTDVTGKKTGESLNSIFQPIMDKGAEYYDAFQRFLYHRHNVDRRSRDRSAETEEARRLWLNYRQSHPELQYYSDQQLASMAVNENNTMYEQAREYLKLLRNYNHTMKTVDKPVFGYEVSAEDSRAIAERLQREHPEFVQEAEKVYKYIDGLLRYRVDSGLITEESYQQLKKLYPHYVPTYRAGQESQYDTSRENTVEIGKTIKRAEGGDSKLMPIHTALARQTYSVVREGSKNRFGQRLMDQHTSGTSASKLIGRIEQYEGSFSSDDFDTLDDSTFKKENVFIVHEGGKRYEIEVSPELFEGIKALSPDKEETNLIIRMAAAGNNAYKQLITGLNPTFMVRNFVRDLQDAGLYTKNLTGFAANYPQAIAQIASNGEYWQQYKALGGMYSSVFDYQTGTVKKESGLKKNTLGKIEALNMAVEQAPRLAEFMATVKKGDGSLENLMEAMYNAADVTTNFGRSGTWGKKLNRYAIPFFNPAIQGTDKFIRNFTETKGAKQWAGLITKCAALGVAPTILNNLLYDDDEEWADIRQSDKDTNYLFKIKDGLWLKIPKGRALSMFGMTADRVTQAVKGEDVDYAEFINTAASQMAPTNPLKENILTDWLNTKLFDSVDPGETWYGSDIENQRMQGYEPGQRYDSKTDEISKWIGEKTGLSPKKINYLLQQYTGVIGDVVLPLLTPSAERDMFSAAFTIDTNYSNELGTRFYDTLDDLEFAKNSENATPADAAVYRYWNKVSGKVSDINAAIRAIEANEELSSKEKKNQTAEQYAIRNALEKSALETLESYEEAVRAHLSEYEGSEEDAADYAYLMANKEMFGAEYAIQTYNKKVYENARELVEKGLSYDTFFDYYFTGFTSDKVTELQKLRTVADSDLTSYQMDTSLRLLMSDNQYDGWMRAHDVITIHDYIDGLEIKKNAEGAKDANGETITNSKELAVMKGVNDMDISDEEKNALFDALGYDTKETIWNTEYEGSDYDSYFYLSESAREGYNAYCSWMEAADYSEYYKAYSEFNSDKDANGKTVKAKKEKVIEYIDDLDLTADQKSALFISFGYAMSSLEDCIWYNPIAMRSRYFPSVGK